MHDGISQLRAAIQCAERFPTPWTRCMVAAVRLGRELVRDYVAMERNHGTAWTDRQARMQAESIRYAVTVHAVSIVETN